MLSRWFSYLSDGPYLFFIPQEADEKLKLLDVAQTEKKSVKVNDPFLRYLPSYPGDLNLMQCIL
jgi:hypothetical protein